MPWRREGLRKILVVVEYDGTRYHGFQLQRVEPTIQGELEAAVYRLTGDRSRITAASRTDSGVHALGQVVAFSSGSTLKLANIARGLNYYLPEDIAVRAVHEVDPDFDPRYRAASREYRYYIYNRRERSPLQGRFAYKVESYLDIAAMNEACCYLKGEHNFASFATRLHGTHYTSTWRHIYEIETTRKGDMVIFRVVANAFLPHQVRNTVGLLLRVGQGKVTLPEFHSIIECACPGAAGPSAPPRGLVLFWINFKGFTLGSNDEELSYIHYEKQ